MLEIMLCILEVVISFAVAKWGVMGAPDFREYRTDKKYRLSSAFLSITPPD